MAEAFLRLHGGDRFDACSAGLVPKEINPLTAQLMQEAGVDISSQSSKSVGEYLGKAHFQYLITLCDDAEKNCPAIWPGVNMRLHWAFEDPGAATGTDDEKLTKFRQVRDEIEQMIEDWLANLQ